MRMRFAVVLGVALIIALGAVMLPMVARSEEQPTAIPSTSHMVSIKLADNGAVDQVNEIYFDRRSVQLRMNSYFFERNSFPWRNIEEIDMEDWENYKRSALPGYIDIFAIEGRYKLSAAPSAREYTVTVYPPEPADDSFSWKALFSPEQLDANKAMMINREYESTGGYIRYADLYEEQLYMLDGGTLRRKWFEPNYMLPVKKLEFDARPDSPLKLTRIYLAEHDFEPSKELFVLELSPFARAGFSQRTARTAVMEWGR